MPGSQCARATGQLRASCDKIRGQYNAKFCAEGWTYRGDAVHRFVTAVATKFGRVEICVTNAAAPTKGFLAASVWMAEGCGPEIFSALSTSPAKSSFTCSASIGEHHHLTSISTKQPVADLVLSMGRAAVVGLVKSLANEFGKDGILVNNVGPAHRNRSAQGTCQESFAAQGKSEKEISKPGPRTLPLKRWEILKRLQMRSWLASGARILHHRTNILVDGGLYKGL